MKAKFSILGIQPLTFTDFHKERLLVNFVSYETKAETKNPEWIDDLEKYYPNKHHSSFRIFNTDLSLFDGHKFHLDAYLLSNTRLNLFTLIFEITSKDSEEILLDTEQVRNCLVLSNQSQPLDAIKEASKIAKQMAGNMVGLSQDDIIIRQDTCNVSIFIHPDTDQPLSINENTCYSFIESDDAERSTINRRPISISEGTVILFGGRVHLIASISKNDSIIIKNTMLCLQFMWFFVPEYLRIASKLHLNIVLGNSTASVDELEEKSEKLSYIAQTIKLQNESDKISREFMNSMFYEKVEDSWGIEKSIAQLGNYASFFETFIKNTRENQAGKADEILNYVLAALAIFGVVGFWASILDAEHNSQEWGTFSNFLKSATGSIFGFMTILFILIGISAAVLLIRSSIKIKHGRKRFTK